MESLHSMAFSVTGRKLGNIRLIGLMYFQHQSCNASVKLSAAVFFFTTKDTNDPKKFHGMNNEFPH